MDELIILVVIFIIITIWTYYKIYWNEKHRALQQEDQVILNKIYTDICKLDDRIKNLKIYSSTESYTENKTKIFLCLKTPDGIYYDYNLLIFVAIHECAHALTNIYDDKHKSQEFKDMFRNLLEKAKTLNIYDGTKKLPDVYCGVCMKKECKK